MWQNIARNAGWRHMAGKVNEREQFNECDGFMRGDEGYSRVGWGTGTIHRSIHLRWAPICKVATWCAASEFE